MVAPATVPGIHLTGTHSSRPAATAVSAGTIYACSTHGLVYQSDGASWGTWFNPATGSLTGQTFDKGCILGDGVNVITTSMFAYLYFPFAATITGCVGLADASGSVDIEARKCTYTAFDPTTHPASGDKISASAPLSISSAKKAKASIGTWTTSIAADDVIMFLPTGSPASIKQVTVDLLFTR